VKIGAYCQAKERRRASESRDCKSFVALNNAYVLTFIIKGYTTHIPWLMGSLFFYSASFQSSNLKPSVPEFLTHVYRYVCILELLHCARTQAHLATITIFSADAVIRPLRLLVDAAQKFNLQADAIILFGKAKQKR